MLIEAEILQGCEKLFSDFKLFFNEHIYPNEAAYVAHDHSSNRWAPFPQMENLKTLARSKGLWNLFLTLETDPKSEYGAGLTTLQYSLFAEIMGRSPWSAEVFNCSAPDTGNMEVLFKLGTPQQKEKWLYPLLNGEIRSCYAMTEPEVASSDALNIQSSITPTTGGYILSGRKWWTSGAQDTRCKLCVFMGKIPTTTTESRHQKHTVILVALDSPGIEILRPLTVFGFDDAPHGHSEVDFKNVFVPAENIILGEGKGFEISQVRLGPGRIHHAMRLIGLAERSLELLIARSSTRVAFGKRLIEQGSVLQDIAKSRCEIDQARLLTLKAARMIDLYGSKGARKEIAMIKVVAPKVASKVVDRAIQVHGGKGVSQDTPLAQFWAHARSLKLADGPDEVHLITISRQEISQLKAKL